MSDNDKKTPTAKTTAGKKDESRTVKVEVIQNPASKEPRVAIGGALVYVGWRGEVTEKQASDLESQGWVKRVGVA